MELDHLDAGEILDFSVPIHEYEEDALVKDMVKDSYLMNDLKDSEIISCDVFKGDLGNEDIINDPVMEMVDAAIVDDICEIFESLEDEDVDVNLNDKQHELKSDEEIELNVEINDLSSDFDGEISNIDDITNLLSILEDQEDVIVYADVPMVETPPLKSKEIQPRVSSLTSLIPVVSPGIQIDGKVKGTRIVSSGNRDPLCLTREQRVARWKEKRKSRQLKKRDSVVYKKAVRTNRRRIKGRFACNTKKFVSVTALQGH